jgi:ferritin-like metal-binding protein YciE
VRPGGEKVADAQNRGGSEAGNTPTLPTAAMAFPHLTTEPFARTYGVIHFTGTPTAGRALRACVLNTDRRSVWSPNTVTELIQMAHSETLKDVYTDEMKDLWSANDQMMKAVKAMSVKTHDPKLKEALEGSIQDIEKHAKTLKSLISDAGADAEKEYCKGMEGLVKEANKHVGSNAPKSSELLDIVIIAQYQRMSHYGLAGFGAAAAYAKALGLKDHYEKLSKIVREIYAGDEYASRRAKKVETVAAQAQKAA